MTVQPVIVVIGYRAQPGKGDVARLELTLLVKEVVAREPDCLGIRLHQAPEDNTRILLYEEWTSRKAYTGPHMQTPHLRAFKTRARELFVGPPTIEFWQLDEDIVRGH